MDLLDDAVRCIFIPLNDHRHVGCLREQGLDLADDALQADAFTAIEHLVIGGDSEKNGIFFQRCSTSTNVGFVNRDTSFFNEDGGDDKENKEDENAVDHRREVDHDGFIGVILHGAAEHKKSVFGKVSGENERFEPDQGRGDFVALVFYNQADE